MKSPRYVRGALAVATCSLLGAGGGTAQAGDGTWQVDTAMLYYGESGRVSALEPEVSATHDLGNDESFNIKGVLDTLTGASANGAQAENHAQTFTSPSGEQNYTVPAGDVPLDNAFRDARAALSLSWTKPLSNPLWKRTLGANVSSETDFFSLGTSAVFARDFNKRNTTLTGGLSLEADSIRPTGGTPVPFAPMFPVAGSKAGTNESRTVTDVMLGVTQVINRKTIMQLNYDLGLSSGYMNDPYKVVTINNGLGAPGSFVYENRPDKRTKQSLYWETKYAFDNGNVLDAGYRYMTDDWGVKSNTLDLRYRWQLPENWYVEPHVREYSQTKADFYTDRLLPADVPAVGDKSKDWSADYRLGDLKTSTFGARVGKRIDETGDAWMSLETMKQSGNTSQADLNAVMLEVGYSFKW